MKQTIKEKLAKATSIPDEILLDTFRIVMTGEREITVENFKGILEYSQNLIRLRVKDSCIGVEGGALEIKTVTDDEIQICGRIKSVNLQ